MKTEIERLREDNAWLRGRYLAMSQRLAGMTALFATMNLTEESTREHTPEAAGLAQEAGGSPPSPQGPLREREP